MKKRMISAVLLIMTVLGLFSYAGAPAHRDTRAQADAQGFIPTSAEITGLSRKQESERLLKKL